MTISALTPRTAAATTPPASPRQPDTGGEGFGGLVKDIINPLQHIPIVGSVYRAQTGDTLNPIARMVVGGLTGGPVGLGVALATTLFEQIAGKEPLAMVADLAEEAAAPASPGALTASGDTGAVMAAANQPGGKAPEPLAKETAPVVNLVKEKASIVSLARSAHAAQGVHAYDAYQRAAARRDEDGDGRRDLVMPPPLAV